MKHSITELRRKKSAPISKIFMVGYLDEKDSTTQKISSKTCDYKKNNGSFKYIDVDGTEKIAWQMGEKTWFDTQEERDQARIEYNKEYESKKYRTQLLERLKELSTEELEKLVKSIDK